MINSTIPKIWAKKWFLSFFSEWAGALRTVLAIDCTIYRINNFLPYYAYANS